MEDILTQFSMKVKKLHSIAEQDTGYITWERISEDAKKKYDRLMRFLPRKIREIIFNYTDAEISRANYVKGLACRYMDFLPEIGETDVK